MAEVNPAAHPPAEGRGPEWSYTCASCGQPTVEGRGTAADYYGDGGALQSAQHARLLELAADGSQTDGDRGLFRALAARLASSSGRAAGEGEALASEAVMEAIELTIKAVDANTKRGIPLAEQEIDYAGILKLALHRSRKALASRAPETPDDAQLIAPHNKPLEGQATETGG